jgi:hypothetical protein
LPIERALETNPFFQVGTSKLDDNDLASLEQWKNCPDPSIKADLRYFDDNSTQTPSGGTLLSAAAQLYAEKWLKGVTSWVDYVPELRRTTTSVDSAADSDVGTIAAPSDWAGTIPSGYSWRKTCDDSTRTGTGGQWERTEKWEGVPEAGGGWDTDLYKEGV